MAKQKRQDFVKTFKKESQTEEQELQCPICYDLLADATETNCGHCFCRSCLKKSILVTLDCPICRKPIEFIHPSFTIRKLVENYLQKKCFVSQMMQRNEQQSKSDFQLQSLLEKQRHKFKQSQKLLKYSETMQKAIVWLIMCVVVIYWGYRQFSPRWFLKQENRDPSKQPTSYQNRIAQTFHNNDDSDPNYLINIQLCDSAAQGNVQRVTELISTQGANVNYQKCGSENERLFPLFLAVRGGHEETTALLLRLGAQVDLKTADNTTALFIAAEFGRYSIVKLLIESGANVNFVSRNGMTPFVCAAQHGHDRIVDYLCFNNQQKPNLYATDENTMTALHLAAMNGHYSTVEILLRCGMNVNIQTASYGFTPLYLAARSGHANIVNLLLENGADVTITSKEKATALYVAAEYGRREVVNILGNQSRLAELAKHNRQIRQKVLSTLEMPMYTGATPVLIACQKGFFDIAALLLSQGVDPEAAGAKGMRALHLAVIEGFTEVVLLLLEYGADPNARDDYGRTPLHYAVLKERRQLITPLLKHGADWTLRDNWGRNSLELAETHNLKKSFQGVEKVTCNVMIIGENRMLSIPMNSISTLKELRSRVQCLESRKVLYMTNEENVRYTETQMTKYLKYLTRKSELTVNVKLGTTLRLKI